MRSHATAAIAATWCFLHLFSYLSGAAFAQQAPVQTPPQPASPPNLRIQTIGGFLGQVEGFCEDPGGTYDLTVTPTPCNRESPKSRWLGGALGAERTVDRSRTRTHDWLIVAPDNQPARPTSGVFWSRISALKPDVIGFGREDFFRWLQLSAGEAHGLFNWIRASGTLPVLASNVVVRGTTEDPNGQNETTFATAGYEIDLDRKTTMSWIGSIPLTHPALPDAVALTATLKEFPTRPVSESGGVDVTAPEVKKGTAGGRGAISFPKALRPGRWYQLTVLEGGTTRLTAIFQTDQALTPIANQGHLAAFPARADANGDVVAVSLVDPGAKKIASDGAWKWTAGPVDYEMSFLDPIKTLDAILNRVRESTAKPRLPAIVLVSAMDDEQTAEVLAKFPEIRFVILPPETGMLARAERRGTRPVAGSSTPVRFSGDLGFASVVDGNYPQATKVMIRPEWFGETLVTIAADLTRVDEMDWHLTRAGTNVTHVVGEAFGHNASGQDVVYTAGSGATQTVLDTLRRYANCPPGDTSAACVDFRKMWTDAGELASAVGDALRENNHADLAIVSKRLLDQDYLDFVSSELKARDGDATWFSRYILERLVYRSPRFVRAYIGAGELAGTLGKVLNEDDQFCIVGIASGCPSSLDAKHPERLRINGRPVVPGLVYAVVVPDTIAEKLELDHSDVRRIFDLLDAADRYFASGSWQVQPTANGLPATFQARREIRGNRKFQSYLAVPTLDVGYTVVKPNDPAGREGVRKNLGLPFSGAKLSRTLSMDVAGDLAFYDRPHLAVRSPFSVKYTRRKELDNVSYDTDEFTAGVMLEGRFGVLRPFVGYFGDGQLVSHETTLTASRPVDGAPDNFKRTETAGFSTTYRTEPRRYWHWDGGATLVPLAKYPLGAGFSATVKTFGARVGYGHENNVPTGVTIAGVEQSFDTFAGLGGQSLLNEYFKSNADTFGPGTEFKVIPGTVHQFRWQGDIDGEVAFKPETKEQKAQITLRYRGYNPRGANQSQFQLERDFKLDLKITIAAWWRLKIVPAYTYQRTTIHADANNVFSAHQADVRVSFPLAIRFRDWRGMLIR